MTEAYLCEGLRTPIGRYGGALASVRPDDMLAHVMRELVAPFEGLKVDEVIMGNANGAGEDNRNVARMGLLLAGLPDDVPGVTVNRLCGSGMEAILQAAKSIMVGEGDCYIAGGSESMTRAPFVMPKAEMGYPNQAEIFNTALGWRMVNPRMEALYGTDGLGITAENVAERYKVSREDQDAWALRSHQRAADAYDDGWFDDEVVSISVPQGRKKDPIVMTRDESIRRDTSAELLAKLKPVFKPGGSVTAGNSSPLNDGSCALLLMSAERAKSLDLDPMARIVSWGHAGVHPNVMGIGPVPSSRKALQRAGLRPDQLSMAELNEAFASQTLASIRELELDPEIVNPAGGAIALGHPLGCSGARIVTTLVHGLRRTGGQYGLATMCIGVGQGIACVVERT